MNDKDGESIRSVLRSLRRVNIQGSLFGQTVAVRFGLSESDIEALESLIDMGSATAGRLSELTGLTSGAVTRVVDRLEQAGYVRRVSDPTDRRRVVVEVVPEKVVAIEMALDRLDDASGPLVEGYTEEQLELIDEFLTRMADITRAEADSMRDEVATGDPDAPSQHAAPLGSLTRARLHLRSGLNHLRLESSPDLGGLYEARFTGQVPIVRVRGDTVLIAYKGRGMPWQWRDRQAEVTLNGTIPWVIEMTGGANNVQADLSRLAVSEIAVNGGANNLAFRLGTPDGDVPVRFTGGANDLDIVRPAGVPVVLRLSGGVSAIELDHQRIGGVSGRTELASVGAESARDRYVVELSGGANQIVIGETTAR
jgi:DNA-binding MarR family transcriptional regulator